ncbi:hypothetical protein AB0I45_13850 [Brevibacterium sp. NPDC049920]
MTNNPFDLNSPFDDIMGRFFGGRDPFSVLGARQDPMSSPGFDRELVIWR